VSRKIPPHTTQISRFSSGSVIVVSF